MERGYGTFQSAVKLKYQFLCEGTGLLLLKESIKREVVIGINKKGGAPPSADPSL